MNEQGYEEPREAWEAYADRWRWAPEMHLTAEDFDWLQSIGVQP